MNFKLFILFSLIFTYGCLDKGESEKNLNKKNAVSDFQEPDLQSKPYEEIEKYYKKGPLKIFKETCRSGDKKQVHYLIFYKNINPKIESKYTYYKVIDEKVWTSGITDHIESKNFPKNSYVFDCDNDPEGGEYYEGSGSLVEVEKVGQ